jgi:hypothetical protein
MPPKANWQSQGSTAKQTNVLTFFLLQIISGSENLPPHGGVDVMGLTMLFFVGITSFGWVCSLPI